MKDTFIIRSTVKRPLIAGFFLVQALARGQSQTDIGATSPASIPYAAQQMISSDNSLAVIAEKAAKVLPRTNQIRDTQTVWRKGSNRYSYRRPDVMIVVENSALPLPRTNQETEPMELSLLPVKPGNSVPIEKSAESGCTLNDKMEIYNENQID
jgi:hypothetical protein